MNIILKPNNRPTEPGFYVWARPRYSLMPGLARVDPDFVVVSPPSIMPLASIESSAVWSDKLDIVLPEGFE